MPCQFGMRTPDTLCFEGRKMNPAKPKTRRSIWVWLISVFYLGFGVSGLMAVAMVLILLYRGGAGPEEVNSMKTLLQASLWGILPAANIAGAVSLFLMRRMAFPIFTGLLAVRLTLPIFSSLPSPPGFSGTTTEMIGGYVLGYGILIAVCIYIYRLRQTGLLR